MDWLSLDFHCRKHHKRSIGHNGFAVRQTSADLLIWCKMKVSSSGSAGTKSLDIKALSALLDAVRPTLEGVPVAAKAALPVIRNCEKLGAEKNVAAETFGGLPGLLIGLRAAFGKGLQPQQPLALTPVDIASFLRSLSGLPHTEALDRPDTPSATSGLGASALAMFIDELRADFGVPMPDHPSIRRASVYVQSGLVRLLDALRLQPHAAWEERRLPSRPAALAPSSDETFTFLDAIRRPLGRMGELGLYGSPWSAAALRRDEIRNASVLSWFLDPRGDHGCGPRLLCELLAQIRLVAGEAFASRPSSGCMVAVEKCPGGDQRDRVDIQVDDPVFFIIIEVKIDAGEQDDQIRRYAEIARKRAANRREWAVVFLTPEGRQPSSADDRGERKKIVSVSWRQVASSLRRIAKELPDVPSFLARSFAGHISNL